MKFYFCESCGRRITEKDLATGLGKDKKLKGVFCTDCAIGVTTMETMPLSDSQAKELLQKESTETSGDSDKRTTRRRTGPQIPGPSTSTRLKAQRKRDSSRVMPAPRTSKAMQVVMIGIGVLAAILVFVLIMLPGDGSPPKQSASANKAKSTSTAVDQSPESSEVDESTTAALTPEESTQTPQPTPHSVANDPANTPAPVSPDDKEQAEAGDKHTTEPPEDNAGSVTPSAPKSDSSEEKKAKDDTPPSSPPPPKTEEAKDAEDGEALKAYRSFSERFHAALRKLDVDAADTALKAAEKDASLTTMAAKLAMDRKAVAWLEHVVKGVEMGAEKLRSVPQFELEFSGRKPMRVGLQTQFKVSSVQDGKIMVGSRGMSMPVAIENLKPECRARLAALAIDGNSALLRAFALLLGCGKETDQGALGIVKRAIDAARKAKVPSDHTDYLQRLYEGITVATAARTVDTESTGHTATNAKDSTINAAKLRGVFLGNCRPLPGGRVEIELKHGNVRHGFDLVKHSLAAWFTELDVDVTLHNDGRWHRQILLGDSICTHDSRGGQSVTHHGKRKGQKHENKSGGSHRYRLKAGPGGVAFQIDDESPQMMPGPWAGGRVKWPGHYRKLPKKLKITGRLDPYWLAEMQEVAKDRIAYMSGRWINLKLRPRKMIRLDYEPLMFYLYDYWFPRRWTHEKRVVAGWVGTGTAWRLQGEELVSPVFPKQRPQKERRLAQYSTTWPATLITQKAEMAFEILLNKGRLNVRLPGGRDWYNHGMQHFLEFGEKGTFFGRRELRNFTEGYKPLKELISRSPVSVPLQKWTRIHIILGADRLNVGIANRPALQHKFEPKGDHVMQFWCNAGDDIRLRKIRIRRAK